MKKINQIIPIIVIAVIIGLGAITFAQFQAEPSGNHDDIGTGIAAANDLAKIRREDGKVNIYFFWGNGCPHCAEETEFFKNIQEGYGDKYNLYTFETWHNDKNSELMKVFAEKMGDELRGVPYTIIGEESFIGFSAEDPRKFVEAIESQSKNNFDVYLDQIK